MTLIIKYLILYKAADLFIKMKNYSHNQTTRGINNKLKNFYEKDTIRTSGFGYYYSTLLLSLFAVLAIQLCRKVSKLLRYIMIIIIKKSFIFLLQLYKIT